MLAKKNRWEIKLKDDSTYKMEAISMDKAGDIRKQLRDLQAICERYIREVPDYYEILINFFETGEIEYSGELMRALDMVAKDSTVVKGLLPCFGVTVAALALQSKEIDYKKRGMAQGQRLSHSRDSRRLILAVFDNEQTKAMTQKDFCKSHGISTDRYYRIKHYRESYHPDDVAWIESFIDE